ncbi:MAG: C45 family peptidase [Acidimicrobiales bacterium]|nr:C45 family peptidase [Acidimicrobiales bacterium]
MQRPPIRVLDVAGSPAAMGHTHGTRHADEIRAYTDERVRLVAAGSWSGGPVDRATVLDLAEQCLPAHAAFSPRLHEEMLAMADGAGITPAEAIVVGGFTDFVDTVRANLGGPHPPEVAEDDCTSFIVPDHRADGAGFFGQTWDMHDSATDYVVLLRTRPDDAPAALVFTTTGCLGQIGMNELGVCVGINNLTAADGGIGVTWPSVVREALHQESAGAARDVILGADLAGGHNFMVFDAAGEGYNIEAMPTARPVTPLADAALSHTNHTTTPETQAVEGLRADALQASSRFRLETATAELDRDGITADDLMALTAGAVCQISTEPSHIESSGAAIMRPRTKEFWACWGLPRENDYQKVAFAGVAS